MHLHVLLKELSHLAFKLKGFLRPIDMDYLDHEVYKQKAFESIMRQLPYVCPPIHKQQAIYSNYILLGQSVQGDKI